MAHNYKSSHNRLTSLDEFSRLLAMARSHPQELSMEDFDSLIHHAVSGIVLDFQSDGFHNLNTSNHKAVFCNITPEGCSQEVAERMISTVNTIGGNCENVFYILEIEDTLTIMPDISIIFQMLDSRFSIKRRVIGTRKGISNNAYNDYLRYTKVIIGLIV